VVTGDPDLLPGAAPGAVLADLLEWGALPVRDLRDRRDDGGAVPDPDALARLPALLRAGVLPEPDAKDRSLVVVPCGSDQDVLVRVRQIVSDSLPRVFGMSASEILVVTPLRRGLAGADEISAALADVGGDTSDHVRVRTVHEALVDSERTQAIGGDGGPDGRPSAVVACFTAQAAGVLSRPMVASVARLAGRHLSVVTAAGPALPQAVERDVRRRRQTRLLGLLRTGSVG
jgi:exodeoxyribonuclease V alpha subunit